MMQTDMDMPQGHSGSLADKQHTADLKTSEMMALWTIRSWALQNRASTKAIPPETNKRFNAGLERAGCPEAADAFATFLTIISAAARQKVIVCAPACPGISDDEKRLLHTLAALQRGHILEAFDILTHILPGTAVRIALSHVEAAALSLARTGLFLPDRTWKLEELSLTHRLRAPRASATCVRYMIH